METAGLLTIWINILKAKALPCVLPPSSFLILRSHQALKVQHALANELPFLMFLPIEGIFQSGSTWYLSSEPYLPIMLGVHSLGCD